MTAGVRVLLLVLLGCAAIYADYGNNVPQPLPNYGNNVPKPPPNYGNNVPQPPPNYGNNIPHPPDNHRPGYHNIEKPGKCPPRVMVCRPPTQRGECRDDGDCSQKRKCCSPKCVPMCFEPEFPRPVRPDPPPPGKSCPRFPRAHCMPGFRDLMKRNRCQNDRECGRRQRCCNTPCEDRCLDV
ncbi:antileukoproteinase-like [Mantella aurantiaca]